MLAKRIFKGRHMNTGSHRILVLLVFCILSVEAMASESIWTYEVPKDGQQLGLPGWRILTRSDLCPADITEQVSYQGQRRSYVQIRYGQSDLARVAMVLDHASNGKITLYVDGNRNRKIEPEERHSAKDGLWHIALQTATDFQDKCILACRFSRMLDTLSITTQGYMQGKVVMDAQRISARRVDADANGQFADLQDRIWLDLNQDGQWDALNEQFTVRPILTLPSGRHAVAADRLGRSLVFNKVEGTGLLVLAPTVKDTATRIQSITTSLVSEAGGAFALRGSGSEVSVPVGRYRVYSLVVVARSGDSGLPWEYVFNTEGGRPFRWFDLKRDGRLTINPLDHLDLIAEGLDKTCQPGQILSVKPVVFNSDGLRINACTLSSTDQDATYAHVILRDAKQERLITQKPGFA
jgi:hypothetical protein